MQNQRVRINWEAFLPASHAILPYKVHSRVTYSETNSSISLCPVSSFTSWHSATFNGILPTCSSLSSDDLYSDFSSYNFLSSINNPPQCQCLKVYLLPKRKKEKQKTSPSYQLPRLILTGPLLGSWPKSSHFLTVVHTHVEFPHFNFYLATGLSRITMHFPFQIPPFDKVPPLFLELSLDCSH